MSTTMVPVGHVTLHDDTGTCYDVAPEVLSFLVALGAMHGRTTYDTVPQNELRASHTQATICFCGEPRQYGDFCQKHIAEMLADPGFAWSWSAKQCTEALEEMCHAAD